MVTRTEKHKKDFKEIKRMKMVNNSKKVLITIAILGFILILIYLYLRFIGTSFIKTNEYTIKNTSIPASFHGTKILHISDILYGSTINKDDLNNLKKEIILIKPDLIVFTGDIIDNNYEITKEEIKTICDFFKDITGTIGKYAIKGELDTNTFDLIMKDTGFNILNNSSTTIYNYADIPIVLNGVNINNSNNTSFQEENNYYTITLIHNFDYYDNYHIKSNLVLAGHNLNGEIYIPFWKGLLGDNKYNGKYYNIDNTEIHISNGLGSLHKLRFFNHPSINIYRLYNH